MKWKYINQIGRNFPPGWSDGSHLYTIIRDKKRFERSLRLSYVCSLVLEPVSDGFYVFKSKTYLSGKIVSFKDFHILGIPYDGLTAIEIARIKIAIL